MKTRFVLDFASRSSFLVRAIAIYGGGTAITWMGIAFGAYALAPHDSEDLAERLAYFDGQHYKTILERGYSYSTLRASNVAFFPLYPVASRYVARMTGVNSTSALLIVSHVALFAAILVFACYARDRFENSPRNVRSGDDNPLCNWSLMIFGLLPTTFFWRCAYSEALFVFLQVCALRLIQRGSHPASVAVVAGIAAACRPVGVALLAPLAWYCFRTFTGKEWWLKTVLCLFLGASGLVFYMTYLEWRFGDAVAFARTQENFFLRESGDIGNKIVALLTLEPIWAVYVPGSAAWWKEFDRLGLAPLSLQFMNPVWFVGTAILVFIGAKRKWLMAPEVLLAIGLLVIPYITRSYEMCMASHGRFAAVVVPAYLVLGRILASVPLSLSVALLALFAFVMGIYAAQFAAGYILI